MGTAATPTKTAGLTAGPLGYEAEYTLVLDTTDASGLMTVDLTDDFSYIRTAVIGGTLASTGYFVDVQKPAVGTALTSTNLVLGFYEAGADGAVLDAVASTDFEAVITGLTLHVVGKRSIVSSWA